MKHEELENRLQKTIKRRRLIETVFLLIFTATAIVFSALREASKEVTTIDFGFISHESVTYNENYSVGIIVGGLGAAILFSFLICDLLFCRCVSHSAGVHHITVYRGFIQYTVYVDGEEKGGLGFLDYSPVVEATLESGTKITVSFLHGILYVAHISFSDSTPSVEI